MHVVARVAYRGGIDNIKASWGTLGFGDVRQLLHAGVDGLGGTLIDESTSPAAGAEHGRVITEADVVALIEPRARTLVQPTTGYGRVAPGAAPLPATGRARMSVPAEATSS